MASNKIEQTVKCSFSLALLSVMQKMWNNISFLKLFRDFSHGKV